MVMKVLIVDDSAPDRLIMKNMLKEYTTYIACDGIEALQILKEHPDINMMILDLSMPKMDGFQVLYALKDDRHHKKLCTIILTNFDEIDNEIKGLKLGAVDFIRKPIHTEALKARIEVHMELLKTKQLLEEKLAENKLTFDTLFEQAPIGIAISQTNKPNSDAPNEGFLSMNPKFEEITGRSREELGKIGWVQITHPEDVDEDMNNFIKLQAKEISSYSIEKRLIKPDNSIVWVHVVVALLTKSEVKDGGYICLIQDITLRKEIERALAESERSKSMLLSNLQGMAYRCDYDPQWTMQFVSSGCFELTGYVPENLLQNRDVSYNDLITPKYRELLWNKWKQVLEKKEPFVYEYEIITAMGVPKWVIEIGQGIFTEQGEVEALEGIIIDISNRKEMEDKLRYRIEHDAWTGLFNYQHLENILTINIHKGFVEKGALVGVNLSAMHSLSATYGIQYSQNLIKKIARKLKSLCNNQRDLFLVFEYRFVFYIKKYRNRDELSIFSKKISRLLNSILTIESIDAGIGIVEIGQWNTIDVNHLLKHLLITSEKAIHKDDAVNNICFYDKELEENIKRREILRNELSELSTGYAVDRLFLQFQPILDLRENRIAGFEALARFKSKKLGLVPPLEFIPIIEETKHIIPIGDIIIQKACNFIKKMKSFGYTSMKVSINISAIQLLNINFTNNLLGIIRKMEVNPQHIILELTESIFSSKFETINDILNQLRNNGIESAIDDFGTGYSSLSRERELVTNYLKIDKLFIDRLLELKEEETITSDIIAIAHKMGHSAVAEGVEKEEQLRYLKIHGCDMVQGYLISKPLHEEEAISFLDTYPQNRNQK